MTLQVRKQAIAITRFPDISKNKGSETRKLGQLIKYDVFPSKIMQ